MIRYCPIFASARTDCDLVETDIENGSAVPDYIICSRYIPLGMKVRFRIPPST